MPFLGPPRPLTPSEPTRPAICLRNLALLGLVQLHSVEHLWARTLLLCLPVLKVLCNFSPLLRCQSLRPDCQSSRFQPLKLLRDLLAFIWKLVGLSGLGPEVGDSEARVQVGSEVVHDADWEHDVHAELEDCQSWIGPRGLWLWWLTLNTSRLGPPILDDFMTELEYLNNSRILLQSSIRSVARVCKLCHRPREAPQLEESGGGLCRSASIELSSISAIHLSSSIMFEQSSRGSPQSIGAPRVQLGLETPRYALRLRLLVVYACLPGCHRQHIISENVHVLVITSTLFLCHTASSSCINPPIFPAYLRLELINPKQSAWLESTQKPL